MTKRKKVQETREYCDNCDGCGWYEGGATLKTRCEKCDGTGIVTRIEPKKGK